MIDWPLVIILSVCLGSCGICYLAFFFPDALRIPELIRWHIKNKRDRRVREQLEAMHYNDIRRP